MSVKSKTALATDVDTILASGSDIRASEHRAIDHDIIDSYEDFIGSYTTAQIASLASPTLRQRVFNTDDNDYEYYDGTRWVKEAHPKYKVYRAQVSQSGTNDPVATVYENNLGASVAWQYNGVGFYAASITGNNFSNLKTQVLLPLADPTDGSGNTFNIVRASVVSEATISLYTQIVDIAAPDIVPTDGLLGNNSIIEIRVYY